jgi:glycosyltransferase involved in cell wall biosynthesis
MRVVLSNASRRWGGVHTVTERLAVGLQARGHEVTVFGGADTPLERRMRGIAPYAPVLGGIDLDPLSITRARRELRRRGTQVLVALMKKDVRLSVPAARLLRIPSLIRHPNDQPLPRGLRGRVLYGASTHVTNAEATRQTILDSAPWLAAERVKVIYNGIDPEPWGTAEPAVFELPAGSVAIGYVGAWEPRKGLLTLAAAWRSVASRTPGAHLLLVGAGTQEPALREAFAGQPRVRWVGYRRDIPAVMRALDVLVLPSYVEGAPNVVLEAMAAGTAVVATAVSGTPELLRDGREGLLVPARDAEALAAALVRLSEDADARAAMGASGAARVVESFSLEAMLDAYEQLLGRLSGEG